MVDERLPASTSYNPIYDVQGDIIGLLNTSGELKQAVRYGPYGDNATASGSVSYSATNDPFLFQGGYHLAGGDTGAGNIPNDLYHYGERYYDPTTGKWTQPDPMGEGYEFVDDNPMNASDRFGECLTILSENVCELAEIAVNSVKRTLAVGTLTPTTGESKKCIKGALVAVGIDASGRLVLSEPFKRFAGTYALGVGCLVGVVGA